MPPLSKIDIRIHPYWPAGIFIDQAIERPVNSDRPPIARCPGPPRRRDAIDLHPKSRDRAAQERRGGALAVESEDLRLMYLDLSAQTGGVRVTAAKAAVGTEILLNDVGQPDRIGDDFTKLSRPQLAGRETDPVEHAPELVARPRIIGAKFSRPGSRRRAADHQLQTGRQYVGEDIQDRPRVTCGWQPRAGSRPRCRTAAPTAPATTASRARP